MTIRSVAAGARIWLQGYITYIAVGGALGLASWALQLAFKFLLSGIGLRLELLEAITVLLAFALMGLIGFLTHRKFVFRSHGSLLKFYFAGACIIVSVALLTALIAYFLRTSGASDLSVIAYPLAAILASPFSYLFKKHWVYEVEKPRT